MRFSTFAKSGIIFLISILGGLYLFALAGLPKLLNSDAMVKKYSSILSEKAGTSIVIKEFKFKTNPNLSFNISVKQISSKNNEVYVNDLFYKSKVLSVKPFSISADKIYFNFDDFRKIKQHKTDYKPFSIDVKRLPYPLVNINEVYIKYDKETEAEIKNIKSWKEHSRIISEFTGQLTCSYLQSPVYFGREGRLVYKHKLVFDKFLVELNNSKLYLTGKKDEIVMRGANLPVRELENAFLYYYKIRHPKKKNFIENFSDFKGLLDVDLIFNKNGINGKCYAKNLGANFLQYKIPVYLPDVTFFFNDRTIKARTKGTFGGEAVYTDVIVDKVGTKELHTIGNVRAKLTSNFTNKYYPTLSISEFAEAMVKYDVQSGIVGIDYSLNLPKGSNISSKFGSFDNIDKDREISANTIKQGDKIKLNKYSYSYRDSEKYEIFTGEGLFDKLNGHYSPVYMTLKTNGNISISTIRSFIEDYLDSGVFSADLKYNFHEKTLLGSLSLKDVKRNDFTYMKNIDISVHEDRLDVVSDGTFFNSPISLKMSADNNFKDGLIINDIDIKLKKYYVQRGNINTVKSEIDSHKAKYSNLGRKKSTTDYKIEVKNGKIYVGEIINSKFYLHDVLIQGSLKNNVVDFILPETEYAKGLLSAVGKYNVANHSSDIYFLASDIDSNEVATKFFKLPNQVEGFAYATLHFISKNQLNDIKADATFAITDGFLPKLGNRQFVLNRPNKFKKVLFFMNKPIKFTLSKICNIDFSKPNVFYSNLRGSFKLDNYVVKDIKIFSESDYLSLFIEGKYEINNQNGNLVVWGRHNKVAGKNIKIFKIPLSLIYKVIFRVEKSMDTYADKLKLIPAIKAEPHEQAIFRVKVDGDLNSNSIKLQFKDIRKGSEK